WPGFFQPVKSGVLKTESNDQEEILPKPKFEFRTWVLLYSPKGREEKKWSFIQNILLKNA
ncbi:MAG: hypothetical protein ABIH77_03375, partial [Pseudomonadota bacterium]